MKSTIPILKRTAGLPTLCVLVLPLLVWTGATRADAIGAGDNLVSLGWLHVSTLDHTSNYTTRLDPAISSSSTGMLAGLPSGAFTSPAGLAVGDSDTLGLIITHFFTDNLALQTVTGIPPAFKLRGKGMIMTPTNALGAGIAQGAQNVDLGASASNPIITSSRQWSPALLISYYFGQRSNRLRPMVGLGVAYSWFSAVHVNPGFTQSVNAAATLLSKINNNPNVVDFLAGTHPADPVALRTRSSRSFSPIFNLGLSYEISSNFYASASVAYFPLKTTTTFDFIDTKTGDVLATNKERLYANPIVTFLGIGYRFRLFGNDANADAPALENRPVKVVPLNGGATGG